MTLTSHSVIFASIFLFSLTASAQQDVKHTTKRQPDASAHQTQAKQNHTKVVDTKAIAKKVEAVQIENADENLIFLDQFFLPVSKTDLAQIKFYAIADEQEEYVDVRMFSFATNKLRATGIDTTPKTKEWTGQFTFYYDNGKVESEGMFEEGIKVGEWKRFTPEGEVKIAKFYSDERKDGVKKMNDENTKGE